MDECVDEASTPAEKETKKSEAPQEEQIVERPNTLQFLAASADYQKSTVPALKRAPYTPDPGLVV